MEGWGIKVMFSITAVVYGVLITVLAFRVWRLERKVEELEDKGIGE